MGAELLLELQFGEIFWRFNGTYDLYVLDSIFAVPAK